MGKRWHIKPHDTDRILALETTAQLSPIVAQLLICRGVCDPQGARRFLDAKLSDLREPEELPGATEAAARIYRAVGAGRDIVVYGDYDADGMTGTAILYLCLRMMGAKVSYYVPNRLAEGYGLHAEVVEQLARRGASLVISVDCGIASLAAAETAKQCGLELIVTDHHEFADSLPDAAAIVHPCLPGHRATFPGLCGAGVAFKLAWAICCHASQSKKVSEGMRGFLLSAIGLAAWGTVADVVPLVDDNRILVRHGLVSLRERPSVGVRALLQVMKLHEKPTLSSEDLAFGLAPRLNAAGRLGQAQLGVELLTTDSAERGQSLAEYLNQLNSSRDSLERSAYLAAHKQIKERFDPDHDPAFVLSAPGWHPGVIGIVAGRLAEKYQRPVILIAVDQAGVKPATGSGRSAGGLNLHHALGQCSELLISHGGHAAAVGLHIDEKHVDGFRSAFCEYVASHRATEDQQAGVQIDAEAILSQLTLKTVEQIERLAPFGAGNPRPVLCSTQVQLAEPPRTLGGGDRHLALKISQHNIKLRAVAFGQGDWLEELSQVNGPLDVAYRPVINEYGGRRSVEIHLVDWRIAERPALALDR
jgi:single-stranded-DNA-specific exonuclease